MMLPLAGPSGSVLGCVRCGGWRVSTRLLTRSVCGTVRRSMGDSAGAPGLFRVDADTSFCGSEDATTGPVGVCVCSSSLARLGGPASRVRSRAPDLYFGGFVLLLCSASSGLGVAPFLILCTPSFSCLLVFFSCVVPFANLRRLPLSQVSGPGVWCLALCFPFLPPRLVLIFFFSFVVRPRCLSLSLVSGLACPGPWRCVLFVLLVSGFSALRALSLLLCFSPGRWLLSGGCFPLFPFPSRGFRRCRSVPRCLFFAALLLPAGLAVGVGSRRLLRPPPPSSCLFCWSPAARLFVCSRCFCVSRPVVGCSLGVAAPPPPLLCLAVSTLPLGAPFFFLCCFASACLLGARRRFSPSAAPPPLLNLFVLLVPCCSGPRVLSLLLCFPPGRCMLTCGCCPPLPFSVFRGSRTQRWVLCFFVFFAALLLPACLPLVGGYRRLLTPGACVVPCAIWCCRDALPFRWVFCRDVLPSSALRVVLW